MTKVVGRGRAVSASAVVNQARTQGHESSLHPRLGAKCISAGWWVTLVCPASTWKW